MIVLTGVYYYNYIGANYPYYIYYNIATPKFIIVLIFNAHHPYIQLYYTYQFFLYCICSYYYITTKQCMIMIELIKHLIDTFMQPDLLLTIVYYVYIIAMHESNYTIIIMYYTDLYNIL